MPVFNAEDYLSESLDSITGQTLRETEIICVDDGSTDSSLQILKGHAERDGRIRIIESENRGCGHARRLALGEARGEYVLMSDSDDKYTYPEAFAELYEAAESRKVDIVIMDYYFVTETDTLIIECPTPDKEIFTERDLENPFVVPLAPWTKLYRKAFLDKYDDWYLPEENVISGDMPLHFQIVARAGGMYHLKKPAYTYCKRQNSLQTANFTEAKIRQVCDHFMSISRTIREENGFKPHRRLIIPYFKDFFDFRLEKYYSRKISIRDAETSLKIKKAAEEAWRTKGDCDESEYLGSEQERKALTFVKACLRLSPENLMKYLDMKYHKNLVAAMRIKDEAIALRDRIIKEQNGFVSDRDGIIKEQDRIIKEKDEHIRNLDELVKSHESQMKRQDKHIREQDEHIREKDEHIRNLDEHISDRDGIIKEQDKAIRERDKSIKALQAENAAIKGSAAYKIGRAVTFPVSAPMDAIKSMRDYRLVKNSGLFNEEWYLERNRDVAKTKANPVKHYLKFGWREGRNPSTEFDGNKYLEERPDVREAGICPLVHYIKFGKNERK